MKKLLILAAALALSACSTLGIPKAETFNQRLAVGYASVTTVRSTAASLIDAGKLTAADGRNVQSGADSVRQGLDVARELHTTVPAAGEDKLAQALAALTVLEKYVAKKGK